MEQRWNYRGFIQIQFPDHTVAQDDRVDAVVVEQRYEVGALAAHVQRVVPAARRENHSNSCVDAGLDRVDLDRRVVNAYDVLMRPGTARLML
jgi:hypothetical protein